MDKLVALEAQQSRLPLFFQRRFWPMWAALSLGTFADNVLRQALLIGVPNGVIPVPGFENADNALPFIGALLPLAIMLFSPLGGQLADRYETGMMFRRTKFTEILLMCLAALAFASGNGLFAAFMLFLMGAQSAFFSPVRQGAMPKYLQADELLRGNGLCNAGLFTFILLGYAVGGALIVTPGGGAKVGFVLIAAAVLGWLASLRTPRAQANAPGLKVSANPFTEGVAMARLSFEARGVGPPLLGVGVFYLLSTAITVATPLYQRDVMNADPLVATALNGLFAIGALIGALCAASLAKGRTGLGWSAFGVFAAGALTLAIAVFDPSGPDTFVLADLWRTPKGLALSLMFIAAAALMGLYIAPLHAALQCRAPHEARARVMATSALINAAFAIPGSLSMLAITSTGADPRLAFGAVGLAMVGIGALMLHRRRTLPDGLHDEDLYAPRP